MEQIEFPDAKEEREEIQQETAKLVFTPEFIPYYIDIKKEFSLSHTATLVYGFIRFYLKSSSHKFYFTNNQMAEIIGVNDTHVSEAVTELKKKELISVSYKMKSGGGKVRFITWVYGRLREKPKSDFGKSRSRDEATTSGKAEDNKNSKDNNIKENFLSNKDLLLIREQKKQRGKQSFGFSSAVVRTYPQKRPKTVSHAEHITT